jgi:hypothetical protein
MKPPLLLSALAIVLVALLAQGQEPQHTVPTPAIGPDLSYTEALTPPMPVSGMRTPLALSAETPRSNLLMGSMEVGAAYDDNVLATPSNHISDVSYLILPSIDIGQTRERWNWDFGYSPGFTINQRVVERNEATHDLHMLFAYRVSPHVTAEVLENFQKSNSLFSGVLGSATATGPGPLQQPNTSGITPFANRTGNTTGLDLVYQFSASSLVGASGNFYLVNYTTPSNFTGEARALINSRSWGGNAFYAHRFSNRHWAGVTYNFQRLLFDPGYRTDVSRPLLFYSISAGSQVTFSVWAGPEQTTSVIPSALAPVMGGGSSETHWGVAGGADLSWEGKRTGARVGYTRQTSDGGGLAQAVRLQQISGEIREALTQRWSVNAGLGYARNNPLNLANGLSSYRSWMGTGGFDYKLTDNLGLGLRYGRDQLQYGNSGSSGSWSNRNRAWFSVSYSFLRPLGR